MNLRRLLFVVVAGSLALIATKALRRFGPTNPPPAVQVQGTFVRDGQYPGEPLRLQPGLRVWGSWAGSDANTGTLRIGPFLASAHLRLAVSGYPHHQGGNNLYLELPELGLKYPLPVDEAREHWQIVDLSVPPGWQERLVNLVAVDASRNSGGWLAVSEPLPPADGRAFATGFATTFAAWLWNGLLLGAGFVATARWLERRAWLSPPWIALGAGAAAAVAGYLTFWAYWANPLAGRILSFVVGGGGVVAWIQTRPDPANKRSEWPRVVLVMAVVGFFHLALLYLYPSPRDFYDLAAHRFVGALPDDNRISHDTALRLFEGGSLKNFTPDWLSSDRPPLLAGCELLTLPIAPVFGFDTSIVSGTTAVWFQLLWVAAGYGLLRLLGLTPGRASAWLAVLALSGFFVQNTVFTWPKLSAGAFTCGAFALWVAPSASHPRRDLVLGAVLAALGWLAHGGVAFSLLPLAPWLAWRAGRGEWRAWAFAAAFFAALALPWLAYQKFYDPPGNRLLKWHLAGQQAIDPRGTWETIRDAYHATPGPELGNNKLSNFATQFRGSWGALFDFAPTGARPRRTDEFFYLLRSLAWCGAALLVTPVLLATRRKIPAPRLQAALATWTALSVIGWCLLMFGTNQAVIHQGSYAVPIGLFILCCAWFDAASRWMIVAVAALQGLTLATTWAPPSETVFGPAAGWPWLALASAALAGVIVGGLRECQATP